MEPASRLHRSGACGRGLFGGDLAIFYAAAERHTHDADKWIDGWQREQFPSVLHVVDRPRCFGSWHAHDSLVNPPQVPVRANANTGSPRARARACRSRSRSTPTTRFAQAEYPGWMQAIVTGPGFTVAPVSNFADGATIVHSSAFDTIAFRRSSTLVKIGVSPAAKDAALRLTAQTVLDRLDSSRPKP